MLRIVVNALRTGVVTTRYPLTPSVPPERFRGAPVLRPGSALPPPAVCPTGALSERFDAGRRHVALDLARCVFCGRCAEEPWADAIAMGRDFELAARSRDDLRMEVVADDPLAAASGPAADPASEAARASAEIRRVLGRSLHLRHLDAGSCNACDWELTALLNPVYDVRRLGIDFVASPRHADGVVVTGPVTRNLEVAVRRTFEAVPDPRVVIAVGACAASGGIVGEGYASAGGVDRVLPVDVYVPGCPPRPEAILFGILVAVGRLEARRQSPGR
ncbi:MAG TPA: NADH-quinone oxidoreductase subunit NuoB [Methylomirabilota bacterium]|jgi:Ni,Fe-hydrogenase III small subunit|nr:NADH-quinone oxidoreductase subunit NuoB [Methylomirabilota bacterium]